MTPSGMVMIQGPARLGIDMMVTPIFLFEILNGCLEHALVDPKGRKGCPSISYPLQRLSVREGSLTGPPREGDIGERGTSRDHREETSGGYGGRSGSLPSYRGNHSPSPPLKGVTLVCHAVSTGDGLLLVLILLSSPKILSKCPVNSSLLCNEICTYKGIPPH